MSTIKILCKIRKSVFKAKMLTFQDEGSVMHAEIFQKQQGLFGSWRSALQTFCMVGGTTKEKINSKFLVNAAS